MFKCGFQKNGNLSCYYIIEKKIFVESKPGSASSRAATGAALSRMLYFPILVFLLGGISLL